MHRMSVMAVMMAAALALCAGMGGAKAGFSAASFRGTYAATFNGTIAGTGTVIADGGGNITGGTETVNDGTNSCVGSLSGSYTVNPDGTGTLTIDFNTTATNFGACPTGPLTSTAAIVLVSRSRIEVSGTDKGIVENGSLTRQSHDHEDEHGHKH
jgi:hypothetical protein